MPPGRKKKEKLPQVLKADRPKRSHSQATKMLISERRRARVVQPRNISQVTRRTSFYAELLNDYKNFGGKKLSQRKKQELAAALKWVEDNKYELGHIDKKDLWDRKQVLEIYEKNGIITEYLAMYHKQYEHCIGSIIYADERTPVNDPTSDDPYDMTDSYDSDEFTDDLGNNELAEIFGDTDEQTDEINFSFEEDSYEMDIE